MSPLSNAENENQIENGSADDKQPLKNGINEKAHIVEAVDRPDEAVRPEEGPLRSMFSTKYKNRKYKMYDNGKRSSSGLSPLKSSSRFRIEQKIKERTGLTRTGLVLLVLCILLTIALLVCAILWPRTAQSRHHRTCIKPSCFRSSAEILPKLNTSGVPCYDFRNYACGNWFSSKPLPKSRTEWNLKEMLQFSYRRKIHELLVTSTASVVSSEMALSWKLMNFYDSCMNIDTINDEKERPLKKIIPMFGGWHVLKDFKPNQWDTYKTLRRLHSEYNVSPFFQIDVVPDIVNKNQNIIQLTPPSLGLPNINYYNRGDTSPMVVSYTNFIKDVVLSFGATNADAGQFSRNIFHYEKRIAEIFQSASENGTSSYARMKISELNAEFFPIKFYEILMGTLPNSNLNTDSFVLIENIEYFRKLPTLLSLSDNVSLNEYLLWRLVADYLPYLSKKYLDAMWTFKSEFLEQTEPVPRWEFCTATLQRFTGFGLMALFENNTAEREPVASMITEMFSETSTAIKKDIFWKVKNSETIAALTDKIDTLGIQIGLPANMTRTDYIDDYYLQFNAVPNAFFDNILSGNTFIRETLQRRLKNPQEEFKWLTDMTSQPVTVTYNAAAHKIIVPLTVLQFPYFEKDYPQTSLYAGLGREIASAFVSSLLPHKHHDNQTKGAKKNYADLLGKCVLQADVALHNITDKETFIVTLGGLKYAYQSLKNKLSMTDLSHQPAMESFDNAELYFISYAQSMCSVKTDKKEFNDNSFSNALSDTQLINSILKQLPEFTDKYSCGSISKSDGSLCNI